MIWAEQQRLPVGFLEQVIEYRVYAAAKADYDRDPTPRPDESALRQLVRRIEFALVQEELDDA